MGLRVLVVDDSTAIRGYVRKQLMAAELDCSEILQAVDGQKALGLINEEVSSGRTLDLIISDVNMPNIDGEQFVASIRSNPSLDTLPILLFSSEKSESRIERLQRLGVQAFVTKPCEASAFMQGVLRAMRGIGKPIPDSASPVTDKPSILIIEAEEEERNRMQNSLQALGFHCHSSSTADNALQKFRAGTIDLIILNVALKEAHDGIVLGEKLLSEHGQQVIYLGECEEAIIDRAQKTNPYGYVLKPPSVESLRAAIRVAQDRKSAQRTTLQSQAAFIDVVDSLGESVLVTNAEGQVIYINPAGEKLCGKVSGQSLSEALPLYTANGKPLTMELFHEATNSSQSTAEGGTALYGQGDDRRVSVYYRLRHLPKSANRFNGVTITVEVSQTGDEQGKTAEAPIAKPPGTEPAPKHLQLSAPEALKSKLEGGNVSQAFAVLFVLDRFSHYEKRYGPVGAASCKTQYSVYLASKIENEDEIFEWGDNAFLVLMSRPCKEEHLNREIGVTACRRLEAKLRRDGSTSMVLLTSTWSVFSLAKYSDGSKLSEEIEHFRIRRTT